MPRLSFHQSGLWRYFAIAAAGQDPDPSGQVLSAQHEVSTTENPPAQNLICRNHNIARKQSIHICLFAVPFWPFLRFLRSFALGPLFYLIFIHPLSALSEAGLMTLEPSPERTRVVYTFIALLFLCIVTIEVVVYNFILNHLSNVKNGFQLARIGRWVE